MSGHSKWSTIKHKKAAVDAKRGKIFTKLIKEIQIAARIGGGDPDANPRLRTALAAARDANMPKDTMERAVKKGTGELEGESYEDFVFEGYGPGGVAIIIEGSTDNRNRTLPEIRHIFGKHGGNLGESGCVAWMFEKKGLIYFEAGELSEEKAMEMALEAGAQDFASEEGIFRVETSPEDLQSVRESLEEQGIKIESASVESVPNNTVKVEDKEAEKVLKLTAALDDHDDVNTVSSNYDIEDSLIEQFS